MANKSLGTLTLDLVAKIGGYTAGLDKAEKEAVKRAAAIQNAFDTAATGVGVAFGAMAAAGAVAFAAFAKGVEEASKFQDLAEETGGSAAGFASLAVAAATAGVDINSVAAASIKLTKNLTGVDDESKAAGAALAALNIPIEDFKKLNPEERIDALTKAFAGFADGTGKTAVALDLFGKSGAEQLKLFKALEEQGGRNNILTEEQIKLADDFADKQAATREQIKLYVSAAATELIPTLNTLTGVMTDVIKETLGIDGATNTLARNNGIKEFADNAVQYLGLVLDAVQILSRGFGIVGTGIAATAATASALLDRDFKGALDIQVQGAKDVIQQTLNIGDNLISGRIKKAQADQKALAAQARLENRGFTPGQPQLTYTGTAPKPKGGGANTAAQEAKAQLDSDLQDIKNAQRTFTDAYGNQEKLLEAMRSAGLTDEHQYYAEKKRLLDLNSKAQEQAQTDTIARLEQEKLTGKDAIDNQKKIAEAQYQLSKIQADAATQSKILSIQEESTYKKIAGAILAARQSAQDYFDTVNQGYASTLAGFGKGAKNRDFDAALQQINEKYQQQRQTLANQRAQAELTAGGPLSATAAKQFDDQLSIINEFQAKSLASYKGYYAQLDEAQKDWKNGATEALQNYADEAANTAKLTQDAFTNAFSGLEDALVNFVKTGKLDFKSLVDSILTDIARIAIKQSITGPLASALGNAIGGSGGGLGSLFGGGGGGSGDALGALIDLNGWAGGGFTGSGNPSDPAGIVHKGEYVLTAAQTKAIGVGNLDRGNLGGGMVYSPTFVISEPASRRTQDQIFQKARQGFVAAGKNQ